MRHRRRSTVQDEGTLSDGMEVRPGGSAALRLELQDPEEFLEINPSNWNELHIHEVVAVSGNITLDDTHDVVLCTSGAGGITVNLPTAVGIAGRVYTIKKVDTGAGAVTIDGNGTETIDGSPTYGLFNQYQYVRIVSDGSNWVIVANN